MPITRISRGDGELYLRYRPRQFSEFSATFNADALRKQLRDRGSKVFLFTGPTGTGKTSAARLLALYVNCKNRQGDEPCLTCPTCIEVQRKSNVDIFEINAADKTGIDDFRKLADSIRTYPFSLSYKIYILDEVHQMSKAAQNQMLKVLEDHPNESYIILATTDPSKLMPTLRGRCIRFDFKPANIGTLSNLVSEIAKAEHPTNNSIPAKDALLIASVSEGSPRLALQNLERYWVGALEEAKEEDETPEGIRSLAKGICEGNWKYCSSFLLGNKVAEETIRLQVSSYIRGMFLRAVGKDAQIKYYRVLEALDGVIEGSVAHKRNQIVLKIRRAVEASSVR